VFEGIEEFVPVVGPVGQGPVHRVFLATVLLGLGEEGSE
jgi:hypothetical protein